MKKKLEADLISIAHRILQLKNKSDINQLYLETQKLYEKLSVLRFVDEHFGEVKPTIGGVEVENKITAIFDTQEVLQSVVAPEIEAIVIAEAIVEQPLETQTVFQEEDELEEEVLLEEKVVTPLEEEEEEEEIIVEEKAAVEPEAVLEEETAVVESAAFVPAFELSVELEETVIETPKKIEAVQISFEDLLGKDYSETHFVKVQDLENVAVVATPTFEAKEESIPEKIVEEMEPKATSLNEKLAKGINIDLNDRIAFTKHLFGNNSEDYNRVLSQLITFNSFYETRDFIKEMVKPDYNNWEGKEDYEERFIDIIEKKFL
jgi:hypothetical protein